MAVIIILIDKNRYGMDIIIDKGLNIEHLLI